MLTFLEKVELMLETLECTGRLALDELAYS